MIQLKDTLPVDVFGQAWDEIDRLVAEGRWKIFDTVADEMHDESLKQWLATHQAALVKFNPTINAYTTKLMAELQHNKMPIVNPERLKDNGDPFVIMLALYLDNRDLGNLQTPSEDTKCCVLTTEEPRAQKVNIPFVCTHYNIPFMNLFSFMKHHGWEITLKVGNP
jgi:hypothetical protein